MNHAPGLGSPPALLPGTLSPRASHPVPSREEHTFRGNLKTTRHGWLRLTPAYSVRLVDKLLTSAASAPPVLDPFCGTGTTLLSCAEHGLDGDTVDINPFLIWLAKAKLARYTPRHLAEAARGIESMRRAALRRSSSSAWVPPLHQIEKWWTAATLSALGRAHAALERAASGASKPASDLLRLAFCQVLIERSRADFNHQSMSFAPIEAAPSPDAAHAVERRDLEHVADGLTRAIERLTLAAAVPLPTTRRRVLRADARALHEKLPLAHYGSVITSPPYANRMSYIRELRPYMYWLKYLSDRKAAGVLDWRAIGGTWGSATSNLGSWQAPPSKHPPPTRLEPCLTAIAETSPVLSTYVRKYFHDMGAHIEALERVLRPGGTASFVVGNSKFYEVLVPVEELLATQFEQAGFHKVEIEVLRKRTSKKELYEYLITAKKP